MDKKRKSLSTKKPPLASDDHQVIKDWMDQRIMPGIKPLITKIDELIHESIPGLKYAIKWGNAYYGTTKQGWLIELAAYDVSANIVFLKGATFSPPPPLGEGNETRYIKVRSIEELYNHKAVDFIKSAYKMDGWQ